VAASQSLLTSDEEIPMATTKKPAAAKASKKPAKKIYTCKTCGRTTTERKHLCSPGKALEKIYTCEYCGASASDPRHVCKPMTLELKYVCGGCGRLATSKSLLCQPKQIKG